MTEEITIDINPSDLGSQAFWATRKEDGVRILCCPALGSASGLPLIYYAVSPTEHQAWFMGSTILEEFYEVEEKCLAVRSAAAVLPNTS